MKNLINSLLQKTAEFFDFDHLEPFKSTRIKKLDEKYDKESNFQTSDFKKDMIIKMNPGYYTKYPYYVLVKDVTKTTVTLTIPNQHDLKLSKLKDKATWNYQTNRMTIIGDKNKFGHLILNQKLK